MSTEKIAALYGLNLLQGTPAEIAQKIGHYAMFGVPTGKYQEKWRDSVKLHEGAEKAARRELKQEEIRAQARKQTALRSKYTEQHERTLAMDRGFRRERDADKTTVVLDTFKKDYKSYHERNQNLGDRKQYFSRIYGNVDEAFWTEAERRTWYSGTRPMHTAYKSADPYSVTDQPDRDGKLHGQFSHLHNGGLESPRPAHGGRKNSRSGSTATLSDPSSLTYPTIYPAKPLPREENSRHWMAYEAARADQKVAAAKSWSEHASGRANGFDGKPYTVQETMPYRTEHNKQYGGMKDW